MNVSPLSDARPPRRARRTTRFSGETFYAGSTVLRSAWQSSRLSIGLSRPRERRGIASRSTGRSEVIVSRVSNRGERTSVAIVCGSFDPARVAGARSASGPNERAKRERPAAIATRRSFTRRDAPPSGQRSRQAFSDPSPRRPNATVSPAALGLPVEFRPWAPDCDRDMSSDDLHVCRW